MIMPLHSMDLNKSCGTPDFSPVARRIWAAASPWGLSDNDALQGIVATLTVLADHELETPTSGPLDHWCPDAKTRHELRLLSDEFSSALL